MAEDKRKYKRRVISLDVEYDFSPHQIYMESKSKDIGGGGICLVTNEPLAQGKEILIKMFLPDSNKPLFINGRVVWNKDNQEKDTGGYLNGIEFFNVKEQDRSLIIKFVDGATFEV
jgi:Tfp pilus assembly protein PilZ